MSDRAYPGYSELAEALSGVAEVLRRRATGSYSEDEWGFDEEYAEAALPFFEFLYDRWWRVQVAGVTNVPAHGRGLIVANHAGSLFPFDATMIGTGILREHPLPRWSRALVLDWAFDLPFVSGFMRRIGGVPANQDNASRLLSQDELVMVFPEGVKGTGKPYAHRYRLGRFGRGGFIETAIRTQSPIIPVAVVGSEEIYPKLAESELLARATGAPFFPLTPTFPWLGLLGAIPLPSRWRIEYLDPIDLTEYPPEAAEDKALMFDLADGVRGRIQAAVQRNLAERGPAFF